MRWLSRQSFLGPDSEAVLNGTVVGLVGLGGGGSHVSQQLAHAGIGHFVLADPDEIEDTNLNRLIGGKWADIRRSTAKVDIAKRLIKGVRPNTNVQIFRAPWQSALEALKRCDVIVGGLDSVRAKDELDAFCRRYLVPYIDMGMDVHGDAGHHLISGQVVLSAPGGPCLKCLGIVTDKGLAQEGARYGKAGNRPQVVWPNGVLASTAVGLVMQIVTPWVSNPAEAVYLSYDGNTGTITPHHRLKAALLRECPHYPSSERGDPGFDVRDFPAADSAVATSAKRLPVLTAWLRTLRDRLARRRRKA